MGSQNTKVAPFKNRTSHQFNEYFSFPKYYKYIKDRLKVSKFKFGKENESFYFLNKLAASNGITKGVAKMWIKFYVDYMILATWEYNPEARNTIYSPYAIRQVAKLHTSYQQNYSKFIKIITENKKSVFYMPQNLVAQQTDDDFYTIKHSYGWAKEFLKNELYDNIEMRKAYKMRNQADLIWEDFEITLLQSEFSFHLSSKESKEEFQKVLMDHADELMLESQERDQIFKIAKRLRNFLGVGDLLSASQDANQSRLRMEEFQYDINRHEGNIMKAVNEIGFNRIFVNLLAWEQEISINEALVLIKEYRRFLFLSFVFFGEMDIYPSEPISQVWKLHMQFTLKYQEDINQIMFANQKGPKKSISKPVECTYGYNQTIRLYEQYFGKADEGIWLPTTKNMEMTQSSKWASYYLFFGKKCITEEQKKKTLEKYMEVSKKNRKSSLIEEQKDQKDYGKDENLGQEGHSKEQKIKTNKKNSCCLDDFDLLFLNFAMNSDTFKAHSYAQDHNQESVVQNMNRENNLGLSISQNGQAFDTIQASCNENTEVTNINGKDLTSCLDFLLDFCFCPSCFNKISCDCNHNGGDCCPGGSNIDGNCDCNCDCAGCCFVEYCK